MRRRIAIAAIAFVASCTALAQSPWIYPRGVLNVASGAPAGLSGGGIARGSIFAIYGTNLGPASSVKASSYPLLNSLAGVSINLFLNGKSEPVLPIYVSATQINAIMPSNAPLGLQSIQVSYSGQRSNPSPVQVVSSSVGIVSALGTGNGPGVVTDASYNVNTLTKTFQPGQAVIVWATGLGAVADDTVAPPAGNLPTQVEVFLGGISVATAYSGRAPGLAGTDQIVFTIPANAPLGCWVPLMIRTEGKYVSNAVTISIGTGGQCSDSTNPLTQAFVQGGNLGLLAGLRYALHEDIGVLNTTDVLADYLYERTSSETGGAFAFQPLLSLPPPGTCTVYNFKGDLFTTPNPLNFPPTGRYLNAGSSATIAGSAGTKSLNGSAPAPLFGFLGGSATGFNIASAPFLNSGNIAISTPGGSDVGPIQASVAAPAPLTWNNRDQISPITMSQGFSVNWSGGAANQTFAIFGLGEDLPTNSSSAFGCTVAAGNASFTVPSLALSNIPPTRNDPSQSKDVVYLLAFPQIGSANVTASGLTAGAAGVIEIAGTTVEFQ